MSEPYNDKEIEEFWGNVQYDNLGSSYCEISGIPQKDWKRLIATVESLKEDNRLLGKLAKSNVETTRIQLDKNSKLIKENAKLKAYKTDLETLCKFLEKENGLLRTEVDLK